MGGFAIDEMKIQVTLKSKSVQLRYILNYNWVKFSSSLQIFLQENLEMTSVGGKLKLVGFVDLEKGHDLMRTLPGTCS